MDGLTTVLQRFQFYDKFSRFDWSKMRRETWEESVTRAVDFLAELGGHRDVIPYDEIYRYMLDCKIMSSLRLLSMAGQAARRNNVAIYNCAASAVDSLDVFVEALLISMAGCGFGFSVERRFVDKLPEVKPRTGLIFNHVVDDSSEGWADALRFGIENFFNGNDVLFDYSLVRPAGAILRTKGGRASGPDALKNCIDTFRKIIFSAAGRKLRPIEVHDLMCSVGQCAVCGGVRRTAMISVFDPDDTEMLQAKVGTFPSIRWNANNSVALPDVLDRELFDGLFSLMHRSRNGEPGFLNRRSIRITVPERRNKDYLFLPNPCQPGYATVLTPFGIRTLSDISVGDKIWSGKRWATVVNKVSSGVKDVYRYRTRYGFFVGTKDHKVFVSSTRKLPVSRAGKIVPAVGNPPRNSFFADEDVFWGIYCGAYKLGRGKLVRLVVGKSRTKVKEFLSRYLGLFGDFTSVSLCIDKTPLDVCREYLTKTPDKVISFLRGLFSVKAIVYNITNFYTRLYIKLPGELMDMVQLMLSSVGILSEKDGRGRLAIRKDVPLFFERVGFLDGYRPIGNHYHNYRHRSFEILDAEKIDECEVFDITVDVSEHSYWTGGLLVSNCGEIILRETGEFCNLSMVIAREDDTVSSLAEKVRLATIIGTIQSTATHFPGLRPCWRRNAEEERLLGVDISGHYDCPVLDDEAVLGYLRRVAVETNERFARILGIRQAAAVTCVKPSGNSSTLFNCSPGIHPRWSKYYIRNVRVSATSPLYRLMRDQGVPMHPENGQTWSNADTFVVHFPVKSPDFCTTAEDITGVDHFLRWLKVKKYYTEHNPSVTIYYSDSELEKLKSLVWENIDYVTGITFLPKEDIKYDQMPFEKITESEYRRLVNDFPVIDFSRLPEYEEEDMTTAAQELSCFAGSCLI